MLVIISLLAGIGLGVAFHTTVPPSWAPYLPMAVMAARVCPRCVPHAVNVQSVGRISTAVSSWDHGATARPT